MSLQNLNNKKVHFSIIMGLLLFTLGLTFDNRIAINDIALDNRVLIDDSKTDLIIHNGAPESHPISINEQIYQKRDFDGHKQDDNNRFEKQDRKLDDVYDLVMTGNDSLVDLRVIICTNPNNKC